jgi:hypothetical protein
MYMLMSSTVRAFATNCRAQVSVCPCPLFDPAGVGEAAPRERHVHLSELRQAVCTPAYQIVDIIEGREGLPLLTNFYGRNNVFGADLGAYYARRRPWYFFKS